MGHDLCFGVVPELHQCIIAVTDVIVALRLFQGKCIIRNGVMVVMVQIDSDKLQEYLSDYYGSAMFAGFPAARFDLSNLACLNGYELCELATKLGIELHNVKVNQSPYFFRLI